MDINRLSVTLCVISTLLLCSLTNFVHTAALDLPAEIQKRSFDTDFDEESDPGEAWKMLKTAELQQQLAVLDEAEARVLGQIQALRAEKAQLVEKKRGHRQCLVNLVACYRKRK